VEAVFKLGYTRRGSDATIFRKIHELENKEAARKRALLAITDDETRKHNIQEWAIKHGTPYHLTEQVFSSLSDRDNLVSTDAIMRTYEDIFELGKSTVDKLRENTTEQIEYYQPYKLETGYKVMPVPA
jgi:hypothetical protein